MNCDCCLGAEALQYDGRDFRSIRDLSKHIGMPESSLTHRLKAGICLNLTASEARSAGAIRDRMIAEPVAAAFLALRW